MEVELTDFHNTDKILSDIEDHFIKILSSQAMKDGKNYLSLQIAKKMTKKFLNFEKKSIIKAE